VRLRTLLATVAHLEPRQVVWQVRRRAAPLRALPAAGGVEGLGRRSAVLPARSPETLVAKEGFRFLNRTFPFSGERRWEPEGAERLWTYHLHYFQYLHALPARRALELMRDWIEANTDPQGTGWEPYPLSMRIREWIEWLAGHEDLGEGARAEILEGLGQQVAALERQIEYHLMGNHLLENGVTLAWAGLSLVGGESERWVQKGLEILRAEIPRQVLPDGTHDERSPMYQALVADALARLARVAKYSGGARASDVGELVQPASRRLIHSLADLTHPDGGFALVNDCVFGMAPTYRELVTRWLGLAGAESEVAGTGNAADGPWSLGEAGYYGFRTDNGTYLLVDAGPVGPDHQPGHGHADTLSFELSHRGRRLVADTGVYTYEPGRVRSYDRSTRAHNTIEIDGRDQSELWAAFRCGRRARIERAAAAANGDELVFRGAYLGPGRLFRPVRHRREVVLEGLGLRFSDRVRAAGSHRGVARLHLAPGLEAAAVAGGWEIREDGRALATVGGEGFDWCEARSPYHPEMGLEIERTCLEAIISFDNSVEVRWGIDLQ